MLDVRRLRVLRELALRGTLAEVATALHQSPSSISQQLTQLEREVGTDLLVKVGRGVRLTPAAELLVEHAAEILTRLERAEAEVAALGAGGADVAGTVHLAAFQSAALAFVPQLLSTLAHQHPRLKLTFSQRLPEDAIAQARSSRLDLVIAQQYPHHPAPLHADLDVVPLTTDTLRLAVPPSERSMRGLADAATAPWVLEPRGAASRTWVEHTCRAAGFEPEVRYETDDLEAHIALIETGSAVGILPDLMRVRRRPDLRLLDLPGRPRREVFTSTRAAIAGAAPIRACREALQAIVPAVLDLEA